MREWEKSELNRDIHNAIYNDDYLWIVCHGPPRSSKTTLALWCAYAVYENWDDVLKATVFNLQSVLHRIENGIPKRVFTSNGLHERVPIIIYDDFGVHSNKADTQHSSGWDIFKGSFDALGTEIAVLLATMVDASEPTQQLQNKYNAELTVNFKGQYKYDKIRWEQDFRGFRTRIKKTWIENGDFPTLPLEVYREYDSMRKELVKESFVRMHDAFATDYLEQILKMLKEDDLKLSRLIDKRGPTTYNFAKEELGETYKDALCRCRARNLILPTHMEGTSYKLDLSKLGKDVLEEWEKRDMDKKLNIHITESP
jgi:DNA-binding ferritin-like protein (Dps family)